MRIIRGRGSKRISCVTKSTRKKKGGSLNLEEGSVKEKKTYQRKNRGEPNKMTRGTYHSKEQKNAQKGKRNEKRT